MNNYPITIKNLINCFKKLPGIGEKNAERLALSILNMDNDDVNLFSESLLNMKTKIKRCANCGYYSEENLCTICNDTSREKNTICVVENPKNVALFEKIGSYRGLYHVLDGLISPLDGINPEDINIDSLVERIKKDDIKEIIIAVKPTIEGETTSLYISKILQGMNVKITKIAHGIPLGTDMEYIDSMTLELAIADRSEI